MTPNDPLPCGHPAACLHDGACGWCAAVQDDRLHIEERDALAADARRNAPLLADWNAAMDRLDAAAEGMGVLPGRVSRLLAERDSLAARVDELEAQLVDAISAREQDKSDIPAGVAVLEHDALHRYEGVQEATEAAFAAHVERLLEALPERIFHASFCRVWSTEGGIDCDCGATATEAELVSLRASTPAASLAEHDRGVRVAALRALADEVCMYVAGRCNSGRCPCGPARRRADAIEREGQP